MPQSKSLRWLTDAGNDVPEDVRVRLISTFFTSITPMLIGTFCNLAINIGAAIRQPTTPFFALLAADAILLLVRMTLLLRTRRAAARGKLLAPDLFITSNIAWAALVGVGTAVCVASRDPVLQFLVPTTMMGIIAGLVTRNNCAPRLALLLIALCDVPLQFAIPFCGEPWMLVSIVQCPLFLAAMTKTVYGISRAYLAMVLAKRDSEERATHDALTGLSNRAGLMLTLARASGARLTSADRIALLYVDLDGFKAINDELGHAAGDSLLRQAAVRISDTVPAGALVARLGGDEFIVVVPEREADDALSIGEAVIAAVSQPYRLGTAAVPRVGASIGIAWSVPGRSSDELLAEADTALYRAKGRGKGCCVATDDHRAGGLRASQQAA